MTSTAPPASASGATDLACKGCQRRGFHQQFGLPTGWMGALVGRLMAFKNRPINALAVDLLDAQPTDWVLEIGFGPGTAIEMLAGRVGQGFIAGVDASEVMLRQASRRNRIAIRDGRVALQQGTASKLAFSDGAFDRVFAVNSFHHWSAPESDLGEVCRVLRTGGVLLLALRMALAKPTRMAAPGLSDEQVLAVQPMLLRAGFHDVRTIRRSVGRDVTCLLASK